MTFRVAAPRGTLCGELKYGMPRPQPPDSAERGPAAPRDEFLIAAERGTAANGLTLLALAGHSQTESTGGALTAYLVRENATGNLAMAVVSARPDASAGIAFSVARELDTSIPGPTSTCEICGRTVEGWTRFCACGNDLSGVAPTTNEQRLQLLDRVNQATAGEVEVFGSIPYTASGGSAYFGKTLDSGAFLALWARADGVFDDESPRLTITTSEPMPPYSPGVLPGASGEFQLAASTPSFPRSSMGSGLLAKQPTPRTQQIIAVPRVCPQCGAEYETGSRFCPKDGTPLRPKGSADPLVGKIIADRYIVLKRLGEGGMGRVYLAEHVKMNRQCAIKVMSASLVNDADSAKRFAREASSAARIIHPNVAAVFDYGESDGLVYIVMEYVDGEPLTSVIARDRVLAPHRALDIARQVLDALGNAHELGIVHRDLKPDNIIITHARNGREIAKVVDFGIAKAMQEGDEALTRTGLVIGTPEFMSPEQLLGDPVDARTDIYSLGCILYQMLTGTTTFQATTREQMIKRRLTEEPPHPRVVNPDVPVALDAIVHRMLARSPDDRYASAAQLRELLSPAIVSETQLNPLHRPTPRSAPTIMLDAKTSPVDARPNIKPTHKRAILAVGAVAVVVLGTLTAVIERRGGTPAAAVQPPARQVNAAPGTAKPPMGSASLAAVPTSDSGRDSARSLGAATRKRADSARPAAHTPPPARLTADEQATHAVIDDFRRAIQAADLAGMRRVFPRMTADQQSYWQKTFFDQGRNFKATVRYTGTSVTGHTAYVDFLMQLRFTYRNGGSAGNTQLPAYRATLTKLGGRWTLTDLRSR